MIGEGRDRARPWGHVTCDGTVANIEAIWSARNLKLYPLAVKAALLDERNPMLAPARDLMVVVPAGSKAKLIELDTWQLLNLDADAVLAIPAGFSEQFGIDPKLVGEAISRWSVQTLGLAAFTARFLGDVGPLHVFVPGSKHYSFPKAVALLGLGADSLQNVPVDLDARLDVAELRNRLDQCLAAQQPVIAVVAVIGTTEESAVDPLADILALRAEFAQRGLVFHVHADAAFGGYHRSLLNEPFSLPEAVAFQAPPLAAPLSAHTERQLQALGGADSITVDPHKSGFIPYPAGALCYRNSAMRDLVTFSAPVVFHGDAEPTVGIYGIEGSKPGAAAAAVYLSHRVIRPTRDGYGKLLGEALFSCRKLYARLLSLAQPGDPFVVVPVARQPSERAGGDRAAILAERARIRDLIDGKSTDEIRADAAATALLREIGPDENILSYACNMLAPDGTVNADLSLTNRINKAIYRQLSIKPRSDIYGYDMIVSTTDLDEATYGTRFLADFKRRLGVTGPGTVVTVLRSVVMNPWVTETAAGSFVDVLALELRRAILGAVQETISGGARGY
jgi:glutamate/tyrosine decarboxylase-like PLP-dependent enzyme